MVLHSTPGLSVNRAMIFLLLVAGAAALLISGASGAPEVTISAAGDQSYFLGEKVMFSGQNTASDSTYLFLIGPNLPSAGANLSSPERTVIDGSPSSFAVVKTRPDKTWEYPWYTANLGLAAGTYTLYAVSTPTAKNRFDDRTTYGTVSLIVKKPFVSADIAPSPVIRGQPFTVTGTAEGIPAAIRVWIFGDNSAFTTTTAVNPDASFTFNGDATISGELPTGANYLVVQHPMEKDQYDIGVGGDYVRTSNSTILFRITGPGSLHGKDAADALVAAFSGNEVRDDYTVDTYTVIPFQVAGAAPVETAPGQQTTRHAPVLYAAPIGAGVLVIAGFVLWKRH